MHDSYLTTRPKLTSLLIIIALDFCKESLYYRYTCTSYSSQELLLFIANNLSTTVQICYYGLLLFQNNSFSVLLRSYLLLHYAIMDYLPCELLLPVSQGPICY